MGHHQKARHWKAGCGGAHLTTREIEVLRLVATGLHSNETAAQLGISPRTVDDHLNEMRQRARAADRGELIARGYAAEILVGWPPRWSGRRCLPIREPQAHRLASHTRLMASSAGGPETISTDFPGMSENPSTNPSRSITVQPRFLDTCCCLDPAPAANTPTPKPAEQPMVTGVLIGYARSFGRGQNLGSQIDSLSAVGCHPILTDNTSGGNTSRPGLHHLLDDARPGDTVVVTSLDRLSRSMQELIWLVDDLHCRELNLRALHENLDTSRPGGQLIFSVFVALAGFLRALIANRTREGLIAARRQGKVGGRPTVMTAEKIAAARALLPDSSIAAIARRIGVSRGTLYAHMDALTREAELVLIPPA